MKEQYMSRIVEGFERVCREQNEKTALIYQSHDRLIRKSYRQLYQEAGSVTDYLEQCGLHRGEKVLLFAKVSYRLVVFMIAAMRMGITVMFVDIRGLQDKPEHIVGRFFPDVILLSRQTKLLRWLLRGTRGICRTLLLDDIPLDRTSAPCKDRSAEADIALLTMTTGSTGSPKIIPRSYENLLRQLELINANRKTGQNDVILTTSFMYVFANLLSGDTTVLSVISSRSSKAKIDRCFSAFRDVGVTMMITSPDFALKMDNPFPALRTLYFGGAILNTYEARKIAGTFAAADIIYIYGSTECNLMSCVPLDRYLASLEQGESCLGEPVRGVQMRIIEDEIFVASRALLSGSLDGSSGHRIQEGEQLWHGTGDAGFLRDGELYYLGRKKFSVQKDGKRYYYNVLEQAVSRQFPNWTKCAFSADGGRMVLFAEGAGQGEIMRAKQFLQEQFRIEADVRVLREIPRDVKHHTKVDYSRLPVRNRSEKRE